MVALDSFYPMTGVTEQLAQWQKFAPNYFGDGVIAGTLNAFTVAQHAPPGMSVDVATGQCFIQGVFGENGSVKQLTIAAADATNPRKDRVVLRVDTVAQDVELVVLTGVAGVSPVAPALVRSATQTDYSICQVLVGTTVTSIVTANITDERMFAGPRGIPLGRTIASATTLEPYAQAPLTDGLQWYPVSGTTTITNIAVSNPPPRPGTVLILEFTSTSCQVTKGGNLTIARGFISGISGALLTLLWDGVQWLELGRTGEQAPAHQYLGNNTGAVANLGFAAIAAADLPAYTTWTLGSITQNGIVTFTANVAQVIVLGKFAHVTGKFTLTSGGTGGQQILLNLPAGLTMAASGNVCVGSFFYVSVLGATIYAGVIDATSTTQIGLIVSGNNGLLGQLPNITAGTNDIITVAMMINLA